MPDIIGSFAVVGVIIGIIIAVCLAIFLLTVALFALSIYLGALLGWVVSLTVLGDWVRHGFMQFGFSVNLTYLGAMLGFIGSLLNVRIISPAITSIMEWAIEVIKGDDDE
jgi:uncharacterized membrane protein